MSRNEMLMKAVVSMFAATLLAVPAAAGEPDAPAVEAPEIEASESAPSRVFLGVDCSQAVMVSLPDDVLTECE